MEIQSELGKKDYWDNFYDQEIDQFKNNNELIGYIWYGKQVQKKILDFINNNITKDKCILDLGCGNSAFLIELHKNNYNNLYGSDYSENSISLSKLTIKDLKIKLFVDDINQPLSLDIKFDLIHDKGTLDAYLLNNTNSINNYIKNLHLKFAESGIFIISSCNHNKNELENYFINENVNSNRITFKLLKEIPHKTFSFGGQSGQAVTSLIFEIINII